MNPAENDLQRYWEKYSKEHLPPCLDDGGRRVIFHAFSVAYLVGIAAAVEMMEGARAQLMPSPEKN